MRVQPIFDLLCTCDKGEKFLIEVQRGKQGYFKERALFYTSRLISGLAPKGNRSTWAYNIAEVYLIALLEDFTLEDSPANTYLHDICLCNRDTGEIFYDKFCYTYIELSKFEKTGTELETELDRWLHVLKNMSQWDKVPVYLRKPIFEKLFSIAEYTNLTKEEKTMYDSSLKHKWDNKNVLDYAVQEAREEVRRKAFEEKKAIVSEMKKDGIPLAQISKFTKLSISEIESI